jgi:hypothetical protein
VIALAVGLSALIQAVLIAALIWRDIDHSRREDRLINLLAARTPAEFAVIQRASAASVQAPKPERDEPRAPKFAVGL